MLEKISPLETVVVQVDDCHLVEHIVVLLENCLSEMLEQNQGKHTVLLCI